MANIMIRNLDDALKKKLRVAAAMRGRSMEAEAREILRQGLAGKREMPGLSLVDSIRRRVEALGGIDLPPVKREPMREPPDFGA